MTTEGEMDQLLKFFGTELPSMSDDDDEETSSGDSGGVPFWLVASLNTMQDEEQQMAESVVQRLEVTCETPVAKQIVTKSVWTKSETVANAVGTTEIAMSESRAARPAPIFEPLLRTRPSLSVAPPMNDIPEHGSPEKATRKPVTRSKSSCRIRGDSELIIPNRVSTAIKSRNRVAASSLVLSEANYMFGVADLPVPHVRRNFTFETGSCCETSEDAELEVIDFVGENSRSPSPSRSPMKQREPEPSTSGKDNSNKRKLFCFPSSSSPMDSSLMTKKIFAPSFQVPNLPSIITLSSDDDDDLQSNVRSGVVAAPNSHLKKLLVENDRSSHSSSSWIGKPFVTGTVRNLTCSNSPLKYGSVGNSRASGSSISEEEIRELEHSLSPATVISQPRPMIIAVSGSKSLLKKAHECFEGEKHIRLTKEWNQHVTHLVMKNSEKPCSPMRTIKFLKALLCGQWIVTSDWLRACAKAGYVVPEGEYEAYGSHELPQAGGPKRARLSINNDEPLLFQDCQIYCKGPFARSGSFQNDLHALVKLSGARLLYRTPIRCNILKAEQNDLFHAPEGSALRLATHFVIADKSTPLPNVHKGQSDRNIGYTAVTPEWFLHCVEHYRILPIKEKYQRPELHGSVLYSA